jgi:hypothetical protein
VQHGVNPRRPLVIFVLLDELMRGVPLAGKSQFNRSDQIIFLRAHGCVLPLNRRRCKAASFLAIAELPR